MKKKLQFSRFILFTAILLLILCLSSCEDIPGLGSGSGTFNVDIRLNGTEGVNDFIRLVSFSTNDTSASLEVSNLLESLTVSLETLPSVSDIWINGVALVFGGSLTIDLDAGLNTITVLISLSDGTNVSCTLYITRESGTSAADTVLPVITLLGDLTVNLAVGDEYIEPGYAAEDNVDGDLISSVVVSGEVDTQTVGTYTLTYSVTDAAGNAAEVTRTVVVSEEGEVDETPPVIVLTGEAEVQLSIGDEYIEPGYAAEDNIDGDLTSSVVVSGEVDTSSAGTYILTYSVTDAAGNAAEVTRTVVVENEAIELSTLYYYIEEMSKYYRQEHTNTAYASFDFEEDQHDFGAIIEFDNDNNEMILYSEPGEQFYKAAWGEPEYGVIEFSYSAGCDTIEDARNASTQFAQLTCYLEETLVPPIIHLNGDNPMEIIVGSEFTDPGATVVDWADEEIIEADSGDLDVSTVGDYTLTYTYIDVDGNEAEDVIRNVNVEAEPIELPDFYFFLYSMEKYLFQENTNSSYAWTEFDLSDAGSGIIIEYDNAENEMIISTIIMETDYYFRVVWTEPEGGVFDMLYTAGFESYEEAVGASDFEQRFICYLSQELIPPILLLEGDDPLEIEADSEYSDPGAWVKDWGHEDELITASDSGDFDINTPGESIWTYSAVDEDGNAAEDVSRSVTVTVPHLELTSYYYIDPRLPPTYFLQEYTDTSFTTSDFETVEFNSGTVVEFNNSLNRMIIYSEMFDYRKVGWTDPVNGVLDVSYSETCETYEDAVIATTDAFTATCYTTQDIVPPVLDIPMESPFEIPQTPEPLQPPPAIGFDWGSPGIPIEPVDDGGLDTTTPGTYHLVYSYTDSEGNEAEDLFLTIIVIPSEQPPPPPE